MVLKGEDDTDGEVPEASKRFCNADGPAQASFPTPSRRADKCSTALSVRRATHGPWPARRWRGSFVGGEGTGWRMPRIAPSSQEKRIDKAASPHSPVGVEHDEAVRPNKVEAAPARLGTQHEDKLLALETSRGGRVSGASAFELSRGSCSPSNTHRRVVEAVHQLLTLANAHGAIQADKVVAPRFAHELKEVQRLRGKQRAHGQRSEVAAAAHALHCPRS